MRRTIHRLRMLAAVAAFVVLGCSGPNAPHAPLSVPDKSPGGRCVLDAAADGARLLLEQRGDDIAAQRGRPARLSDLGDDCLHTATLPDLDGDGATEVEVTSSCYWGAYASARAVYLSNRGCLQRAGVLLDGELTPVDDTSFGVRGLEARVSNGCAGSDFHWTRYRWDGSAFQRADQATCNLCPDSPAPGGAAPQPSTHPFCLAEIERRARHE